MKIVLHSDDINLLTYWQKAIGNDAIVIDDISELSEIKSSLIIINYLACKPSCEILIKDLIHNENKVLVLHRVPDLTTAKTLLKIGAMGYGNALMREHFLLSAIETIKEDMVWLYPEFTTQLITELPTNEDKNNENTLSKLTLREVEVALLLKDGNTYKDVAKELDITPRTVKAHAQNIYTKLNVKDRIGLALLLK
jgi:DNA-binding NarL/FixJ family response regulator